MIIRIRADCTAGQHLSLRCEAVDPETGAPSLLGILYQLCEWIQYQCGGEFVVECFDVPWRLDVWGDLVFVLEQIPEFIDWVRDGCSGGFLLEFYGGRGLRFERSHADVIRIEGQFLHGYPDPVWPPTVTEEILVSELLEQLERLLTDFLTMAFELLPYAFQEDMFVEHFGRYIDWVTAGAGGRGGLRGECR